MKPRQFEIWIAYLNPKAGTEAGKIRPVVTVQTDLLNATHPSTVVCSITTNVQPKAEILRAHLKKTVTGPEKDSDIMIGQIRAIDNRRQLRKVGSMDAEAVRKISENIKIVLGLD